MTTRPRASTARLSHDRQPGRVGAAVVADNPRTIVVVKSGGQVLMPWGARGRRSGSLVPGRMRTAPWWRTVDSAKVNPSRKLTLTFPVNPVTCRTNPAHYPGP